MNRPVSPSAPVRPADANRLAGTLHPWLRDLATTPAVERVGGKATGLYMLHQLGLAVPPFVVLTTDAYAAACPRHKVPETLPPEAEAALDQAWQLLNGDGQPPVPLAARSSAVGEDAAGCSYAGQMDTRLNVATRAELSQAVRACWQSLHGERAVAYRQTLAGQADQEPSMAVVLQRMIQAKAAGVVFTVNPANGRHDEILISAVLGLGEGLVSGALDADTFVVQRDGTLKTQEIAHKSERFAGHPAGGTERLAVPDAQADQPALAPAKLAELARLAVQAENSAGHPLDIEFAVDADNTTYFLQARPVTAFHHQPREDDGNRQVWDNSNIIESYPGITLPLTFSFIRQAYHAVYWQFCQVLGLREDEIRRHDHLLRNMLGLLNGRVYYNLLNWYGLVSLLPGFRWNKKFMEAMMGVQTPDALPQTPPTWRERYLVELPRMLRVGGRAIFLHLTLKRRIRRFQSEFQHTYADFAKRDFASLRPDQALAAYRELETAVLWKWKPPIINDFEAMICYGLLKKLTVAWNVDPDGSLQNALICGQGSIESTLVTSELLAIVRLIAANPELHQTVAQSTPAEALKAIQAAPAVAAALARYLDAYGDRCIGELKLESIPMKEDPRFCISMIQNYLRLQSSDSAESLTRHEEDIRQAAERQIAERLHGTFTRFGLPRLWLYRRIVKLTRNAIRNRENQRLARTRAYALVRQIFRSIGHYLARLGAIADAEDIFYLEVKEIEAFVDGAATVVNLNELVKLRRAEYQRYRSLPPLADHLVTHGPASCPGQLQADELPADGSSQLLTGLGACPGRVEKPAIVLLEPDSSVKLNGEILVASQTDPGWVVLFPGISGLIVERGSMLSHSAIVAREMGIPAVVGVNNATRIIHTGDRLQLDGSRGTIQIIQGDASP